MNELLVSMASSRRTVDLHLGVCLMLCKTISEVVFFKLGITPSSLTGLEKTLLLAATLDFSGEDWGMLSLYS